MSLKGKLEAIIYAAEEPITVDQLAALLKTDVLAELASESANAAVRAEDERAESESAEALQSEPAAEQPQLVSEPTADAMLAAAEATAEAPSDAQAAETAAPDIASKKKVKDPELAAVKAKLRVLVAELVADYQSDARGIEIRQIAGGYRMATKPEHHDAVVGFAKSLKPPIRLSLQALETLAVVAYKQPVTAPEVSEIRGVDSSGVIATLLDRKLVTTAGRKQVIGRPILYKTTKEFLLRFGLKDVNELPSMEEFEKLGDAGQGVMFEEEPQTPAPTQPSESEAERVEDAMMAREDEMVAESSETPAASEETETPIAEAPGEATPVVETKSEPAEETSDVHGSTNENS
jgi:segregation and condensation protein B